MSGHEVVCGVEWTAEADQEREGDRLFNVGDS